MAFKSFSLLHGLALLAIAGFVWLSISIGRRQPYVLPSRMERFIGGGFLLLWLGTHLWLLTPSLFNPLKTLPLQMCHWTAFVSGLVLLTGWRPYSAVLYFWGIALCTQALLTPTLVEGPSDYRFWYFWVSHGMIIGVTLYDLVVRRFRPTWRDYRLAVLAAAAYFVVVMPINLVIGANYGFLGKTKPEQTTLVDVLGPWPERLVWIALLVAAAMALLMLPWRQRRV